MIFPISWVSGVSFEELELLGMTFFLVVASATTVGVGKWIARLFSPRAG